MLSRQTAAVSSHFEPLWALIAETDLRVQIFFSWKAPVSGQTLKEW